MAWHGQRCRCRALSGRRCDSGCRGRWGRHGAGRRKGLRLAAAAAGHAPDRGAEQDHPGRCASRDEPAPLRFDLRSLMVGHGQGLGPSLMWRDSLSHPVQDLPQPAFKIVGCHDVPSTSDRKAVRPR